MRAPLSPFGPSAGAWSDADLLMLRRFSELVRTGAVRRQRARQWHNLVAALELGLTIEPLYADVWGRAEIQMRAGLLEIATEGMRELEREDSERWRSSGRISHARGDKNAR